MLGILGLTLVPLAVCAVPFVDREIPSGRIGRIVQVLGGLGAAVFVGLTLWGWWS